jgi:signal transduction protein with GAF and PtsI domain
MSQIAEFDQDLLEIYSELDRDRLMALVVRYARDRLGAEGSSVFLRDDISGRYVLRGTTGLLDKGRMPAERIEYEVGEGLTGWIAKHGRPLRIANVKDSEELRRISRDLVWSKKYSEISAQPGLAYLGVPILARDGETVLGVLRVSGKAQGEEFDAQGAELLSHVARMVSVAIENSQRYEREKRRARYFWLLLDINSELDPRRPVGEMLQAVTDRVQDGFRTEACLIYLRAEEDVQRLVLRAASGVPRTLVGQLSCRVGEGLTGHAVRAGTAIQIREACELAQWDDPHVEQIARHLPSSGYRSFVGVPLRLGDEILGTLELVNKIPSSPGHRDWFTDDDEGYLRLLSTAVGGVLEGARYLKALNEVGVTAMRMQRVASFGTLAQRIRHEASNPLAVARLAVLNLRRDLESLLSQASEGATAGDESVGPRVERRLDVIQSSLDKVSGKLLDLLKFSQHIGFVRTTTGWGDVVREALIWLAAERQRRGVQTSVTQEELPPLFVEPNELFGVVVTVLRLAMEALGPSGGLVDVHTFLCRDGQYLCTQVTVPDAPQRDRVMGILEPTSGEPEELSPLHFEWALAQETVEMQYGGRLTAAVEHGALRFAVELPLEGEP